MTDPTPQTPTRDEAVRDALAQTERRENGLRANMDEVATLAHQMIAIVRRGALRPDPQTGWLASAPAPASGRVDAVRAVQEFDVRDYVDGYEFRGDEGDYQPTEEERVLLEDAINGVIWEIADKLRSLSPAATPVSEAGGEPDMWSPKLEAIRLLKAEDTRQLQILELLETIREQVRLGVKPEHRPDGLMNNLQTAVYGLRGRMPLLNDAAIMVPLQALAKPASSPACGDVARRVVEAWEKGPGTFDSPVMVQRWIMDHMAPAIVELRAALSQSTSDGRVGE